MMFAHKLTVDVCCCHKGPVHVSTWLYIHCHPCYQLHIQSFYRDFVMGHVDFSCGKYMAITGREKLQEKVEVTGFSLQVWS